MSKPDRERYIQRKHVPNNALNQSRNHFAGSRSDNNQTWLVEDRQTKIGSLKLSIIIGTIKQEILRLEISMHHTKGMTRLHHAKNRLNQLRSLALAEMPFGNDPIEKLPAFADLHDNVHEHGVLVGPLDPNHVGVLREVVHDLNLAPHILVILAAHELALGDRFAGVVGGGGFLRAEIGRAELALA